MKLTGQHSALNQKNKNKLCWGAGGVGEDWVVKFITMY